MRVLFMNSMKTSGWRGGEKWMVEASAGLTRHGHDVHLAVRPGGIMAEKATTRGVKLFPISYGADLGLPNALRIRRFLSREKIDLVCNNFEKENRLVALGTLGARRPVMVARKGLPFIFDKWRYRFIYKHWVKHIVTPSQSIERCFREYRWLDHVGISAIPNGVRIEDYPLGEPAGVLKRAYGVSDGVPVLGFVGDLARQKGVRYLLKTVAAIDAPWHLFIVGDGGDRPNLERLCDELELRDRTTFTGHRDDIPVILPEMDIVVLPSLYEGMPNALMEAMAAGRAVVASAVDGVRELIVGDDHGLTVPAADLESLRAAISSLLADPQRRVELGRSARQRVADNFSVETMVKRLESLFCRLLEEAKSDG
jgi:glycosyltransferase involved in cell wall biosynthesis